MGYLLILLAMLDFSTFGLNRNFGGVLRFVLVLWALKRLLPKAKNHYLKVSDSLPRSTFSPPSRREVIQISVIGIPLYAIGFAVLTYPMIFRFSSHFWSDGGDGYQMLWNAWWFDKAVTSFQNPFSTPYLHFPFGISLLGASYHPLKSLLMIPIIELRSLVEGYNAILWLTFVLNGVFTAYLAFAFSGSLVGSLFGGFVVAFSNNRFAHADGHFHQISTEWIPLFLLLWLVYLHKPSRRAAFWASFVLLLNLLCDHYAFFYSVIAGAFFLIWKPTRIRQLLPFIAFSLLLTGPLVGATLWQGQCDQWVGIHSPRENPMDLFGLLIPGGHWYFSGWTKGFWAAIKSNDHEGSVHLGICVIAVLIGYLLSRRRQKGWSTVWYSFFLTAWVLSLGPFLNVWGKELPLSLPYLFLHKYVPGFSLSGVPVRFMALIVVAAAVLIAMAYRTWEHSIGRIALSLWVALMLFEYWPAPIAQTRLGAPEYVHFLKTLPSQGVLDLNANMTEALFFQTVHEKPQAFGYVARVPLRLVLEEAKIRTLWEKGEAAKLCGRYQFRYVVEKKPGVFLERPEEGVIYQDAGVKIYDLTRRRECFDARAMWAR